jgi:uncharacterized protein (DUF1697 family)
MARSLAGDRAVLVLRRWHNRNVTKFVAFLGGINVGGHRVTMDRLRAEFLDLGFENVATFIASGNVIFTSSGRPAGMERRIEQHLADQLGWPVPTFVRRATDVLAIVEFATGKPFGAIPDGHTHMVALTQSILHSPRREEIEKHSTAHDRFHVHGSEVHWLIDSRMSDSSITLPKLAKLIGRNTTRNITSLTRLADRL